jgi:predicted NAD/FAD-dependent oxidoreductase
MKVIFFKAWLAGLTCAKVLREHVGEVAIFEASDSVGRILTDKNDSTLSGEKVAQEVLG